MAIPVVWWRFCMLIHVDTQVSAHAKSHNNDTLDVVESRPRMTILVG